MKERITIRVSAEMAALLQEAKGVTSADTSKIVREALRRHLGMDTRLGSGATRQKTS